MDNRESLARKLQRVFRTEPLEHWIGLLEAAGLPVGRVLELEEALTDPQARHNEMVVEIDHPVAGPVRTTGSPIRLGGSPARAPGTPPTLGQHTRPLLLELGVDDATIDEMVEQGNAIIS